MATVLALPVDAPGPHAPWANQLSVDSKGRVRNTLANATIILRDDPRWAGVLGYDARAEQPVLLSAPPFEVPEGPLCKFPRTLRDGDDVRTIQWLEHHHGVTVSLQNVHAALNAVAELEPFDRVRDYLEGLAWDGTLRTSIWLANYLGADCTTYATYVGKCWLISAVARTIEPGCKADHVLVLEGAQGIGKSTALRVLAGDDYFGDDIPLIGSKDAQQYLGGMWIMELAEMDAASRAEAATLKRFLTTTVDRYRPPYGRRMILHPRRCVFAGSVNAEEYLRDSTGGRRFWPVPCGTIDLPALKRDRDQLWAEAVALYRQGEPWHLDSDSAVAKAAGEQARRVESDPWEDAVRGFLDRSPEPFVTTSDLLQRALDIEPRHVDKRGSNRVGGIMRGLGWQYGEGHARQRGWHRPQGAKS